MTEPLKPFRFTPAFVAEQCDFCGECFQRCPEFEWPLGRAQAEMHALVEGRATPVLEQCTGCMGCNSYCPTDANPHALILARWNERYLREGIPMRGALVLPYQQPNFYSGVVARLPKEERALVDQWRRNWLEPPAADTMIYSGCNMLLQPLLLDSALFAGIPVFGAEELCCGEPLYRMGCRDAARTVAERLRDEFTRMGLRRIIVPCLAGEHLFRHVYPEVLGVPFDFEIISILDYLMERLDRGDLKVTPLNRRAAVHDNCWPKASGDHCFDQVRALLARIGVEAAEPAHTREEALCCGMCAGAARHSLRDTLGTARKRMKELRDTGADAAVDYCGGCSWLFTLADQLNPPGRRLPVFHIIELVQAAIGEHQPRRIEARARGILLRMAGKLARSYLTRRHFWIRDIAGRPVAGSPADKPR